MNLFQPSDASSTTTGSPSPAVIELLKVLLNASAQPQPTFKDFVGGARKTTSLPPGLGDLVGSLGPNAFRTNKTTTTKPSAPGLVSDLGSILVLLSLLGGGGGVGGALKGLGGGVGSILGGGKNILGSIASGNAGTALGNLGAVEGGSFGQGATTGDALSAANQGVSFEGDSSDSAGLWSNLMAYL